VRRLGKAGRLSQPRLHRMKRPQRFDSARNWIQSGALVNVGAYAGRYGVDRFTAYSELAALGVPPAPSDARWAVRPPPLPRRRQVPMAMALEPPRASGWILFGDTLMFPVGFTDGGVPYGATIDDLEDDDRAPLLAEVGWEDPGKP